MAITEYQVIQANNTEQMTGLSAAAIADDWQPYGAPFQRKNSEFPDEMICQAFVKGTPNTLDESTVEAAIADLAAASGFGTLLAAGLGASGSYDLETDGEQELLEADAAARVALIVVVVTEEFADGDGGQTAFTIGEEDTADSFTDGTVLADASEGDIFLFAGPVSATKALTVTGTPATGTGTGAIAVTALVLPAAQ